MRDCMSVWRTAAWRSLWYECLQNMPWHHLDLWHELCRFGVAALREALVRVCPCVKSRREAKVQEQQMAVRSGTNGQDGVH